jgi:excisionase family DNA binding protein
VPGIPLFIRQININVVVTRQQGAFIGRGIVMNENEAYKYVFKDYPDVVSVNQMCLMLRISEKTGYKLLRENKIVHYKVGKAYKIPKLSLFNFLKIIDKSHA